MKLVSIELENLNSLYGRHAVDFETALRDAPLFLIVGPTGSGKSTLVDAVSLALFGSTARLSHATATSGDPWDLPDDPRQVVSRGTIRGWARVVFEKNEGGHTSRFRALWECHRSRKQIEGALQKPRRTLETWDGAAGEWVTRVSSDKNKEFAPHFEDALDGLTVDDFHRCMVLPQGEFAAFLHAKPDERSAILERLTDTAAYKLYGERANEKRQAAQREFDELHAQLAGIDAPDASIIDAMRAEEAAFSTDVAALRDRARENDQVRVWHAAERSLRARLDDAVNECAAIARARADGADDLRNLEMDERCANARSQWSVVVQRRGELAAAEKIRTEANRRRDDLLSASREADAAVVAADAAHAATVKSRDDRSEAIAAARVAWSLVRIAEDASRRANEAATTAVTAWRERESTRAAAAKSEHDARAEATQADEGFARVAGDARLSTEVADWRARARTVASARDSIARSRKNLDAVEKRCEERAARRAQTEAERSGCEADLANARRVHDERSGAFTASLDGADDVTTFRARIEARTRRASEVRAALEDALRTSNVLRAIDERVITLRHERTEHEQALDTASRAIEHARSARADHDRAIDTTRARREEIGFAIGLGRERHRLRDGEPCALCGSTDHPYAHDHEQAAIAEQLDQRASQLDADLARRVAERNAATNELERAEQRAAESRTRIAAIDGEHALLVKNRESARSTVEAAAERAGVRTDEKLFEGALIAVNDEISRAAAAARAVDSAARSLAEATERLRRMETTLRECAALLASIDEIDRNESSQALAWRDEIGRAEAHVSAEERSLATAMGAFAIAGDTFAAALRVAEARTEAFESARSRSEQTRRAYEEARTEALRWHEFAAEAVTARDRLETAAAACRAEFDESRRIAAATLDGAEPDVFQATLQRAVDAAAGTQRDARERQGAVRVRYADAEASLRAATAALASATGELETADRVFRTSCDDLGLDAGVVLASALDESKRVRLQSWRASLERRDAEARTRRDDRDADVQRHRNGWLSAWDGIDAATAERRATEIASELEARERALASMRARIDDATARRERAGALGVRIEQAREALEVWRRLHGLIGVRNGEAFRQFAQSLNLDELIAHANEHLARLAPRYRLDRVPAREGEVSLAFAVRDAWHADESRPIATLSGGETFLVSLGLALGLAGMRNVRLPIETLLLDEGFGTLDPDALDTAVDALDGLRERGISQVGIITHVSSLRERVEARVIVEPVSPGRSQIRVECGGTFVEESLRD